MNIRRATFILTAAVLVFLGGGCASGNVSQQMKAFNEKQAPAAPAIDEQDRTRNKSYEELLALGDHALQAGNSQLAKLYYAMAGKRQAGTAEVLVGLGNVFLLEGQPLGAARLFDEALSVDESCAEAFHGAGKAYRLLKNHHLATQYFEMGLELQKKPVLFLNELALCMQNLDKFDEASRYLHKIIETGPPSSAAYNNLGFNDILLDDYDQAIFHLEKARSLAPADGKVANNLALAYALNGDFGKAGELFRRNLDTASALNNLGYIMMIQGNVDQAANYFSKALEEKPAFYIKAHENYEYLTGTNTLLN